MSEHAEGGRFDAISGLLKRRDCYERIFSRTAAVAAILVGLLGYWIWSHPYISLDSFFWYWVVALILVDGINTWQLYRSARKEGRSFPSSGLLLVAALLLPIFLIVAGIGTLTLFFYEDPATCSLCWLLGIGMIALSQCWFLPRSFLLLGGAIFLSGFAFLFYRETGGPLPGETAAAQAAYTLLIGLGLPMAVFSICCWRTHPEKSN